MRYGFLIDHSVCIGCHACTVACKAEHDVPVGEYRTWVKYVEEGAFPDARRRFAVLRCNHCSDAPCMAICPTTALFRRDTGIVDFDSERCIGCKSCMQACPYDALYIHPDKGTAQKCNYCAHKVELGLEPACVTVCPTQAIVPGDLDDPTSLIARRVAKEETLRRKPEMGTNPNVHYVGGAEGALKPGVAQHGAGYMWSNLPEGSVSTEFRSAADRMGDAVTRVAYDVKHPAPWGWKISVYLWTKALSAGAVIVPAVTGTFDRNDAAVAMAFLLATMILLVGDLKKPSRFLYIVLKPQWKSWLVLGGAVLGAYGGLLALWLLFPSPVLLWPLVPLAAMASLYSIPLFRQAVGRPFWRSGTFAAHLPVETALLGCCVMGLMDATLLHMPTIVLLAASGVLIVAEGLWPHGHPDVERAADNLMKMPSLWLGSLVLGHAIPAFLIAAHTPWAVPVALPLALGGQLAFNGAWVRAGQSVPLS